jgi:putative peptide zinc metalloprotease protein
VTLQLRPTFSESWYRVKTLKVKLRPGAQISRQYYRGERWYVVRDPAGNQFHRLSDPAYRFVGLLDGSRSVEEAWDLCGGQIADDAPTQPEVIQILSHLYSANLIDADVTPDATVLLRRHKTQAQKKFKNRLMNVLFPRIPLWDPDRFLVRWMPLVKLMFSRFGAFIWLAVILGACAMVASANQNSTHNLTEAAKHAVDVKGNTLNLLLLWSMFVFIKLIHELGHAFGCRRFGGECHELGIMFLVFIPTPYVDASTAWGFSNKWQRIFVGAAGMIVELFFASICAFVWCNLKDPNNSILGQLMFNAMLVASVTTIIFNANPLLRYDGYYILSDWLEIPNLRQKSTEYTLGLLKRHVFRVKQQHPLPPYVQRFWLFMYAVTSSIYRVFVGIMIILLVAFQIPILGILMALGGVVTWVCMPVFKTFKYLAIEPELHRKRGRATAFTLAVVSAAVIVIGVIPWPQHIDALAIAEPAVRQMVRAEGSGRVVETPARDGQWMNVGDMIVRLKSDELEAQLRADEAQLAAAEAELQNAIATSQPRKGLMEMVTAAADNRDKIRQRIEELTVRAKQPGWLIAPNIQELQGQTVPQGQEIAMVIQADRLELHTALQQADAELIPKYPNAVVTVRMAGDVGQVVSAGTPRKPGDALPELRHPGLSVNLGGDVPTDPSDPRRAAVPVYDIAVPMDNPEVGADPSDPTGKRRAYKYVPFQRAHVRFTLDHKPLAYQWARRLLQVIDEHAAGSSWM